MNAMPRVATDPPPANDLFKERFPAWLWASMIGATVIHFATFALWPTLLAPDQTIDSDELVVIDVPEVDLPEAPEPLVQPAYPVAGAPDLDDLTIAPTTIDTYDPDDLPPPPDEPVTTIGDERSWTPFTVAPAILNMREIVRAMERAYPAHLRDAGIGGTVEVRFHIGEDGTVRDFRLERGSGHDALDRAALSLAELYRFSPALNRDRRVAVWVVFPIRFEVRR